MKKRIVTATGNQSAPGTHPQGCDCAVPNAQHGGTGSGVCIQRA